MWGGGGVRACRDFIKHLIKMILFPNIFPLYLQQIHIILIIILLIQPQAKKQGDISSN